MTQEDARFPKDFVFGAATAAYQCEGETRTHGKGKVAWDDYLDEKGLFSADPASDFYHRYPEDLRLCQEYGINGIRVSIAWSRIFPNGDDPVPNSEGVAFYHRLFAECRSRGVEPYVTLHHFDSPDALYREGDFLNQHAIDAFERYARFCFAEYPEVTHWFTFNEIWAIVSNMYIEGTWPRGQRYRLDLAFQAMHNMMVAHARAVLAFEELGHPGSIGVVHALSTKYPDDPAAAGDVEAARIDDVLNNQFLLEATFDGRYSEETLDCANRLAALAGGRLEFLPEDLEQLAAAAPHNDCLGINYYQSNFLKAYDGPNDCHHNSTGEKGTERHALQGIGEYVARPEIPRTDWDWMIYPQGLYDLVMRICRQWPHYKELYVTENGMASKDRLEEGAVHDEERIHYIREHLRWALKAIAEGAHLRGYFVWSLMDVFSWNNGYNKRYGLFYVDFDTQERIPKDSARWYAKVAQERFLDT